MEENNNGFDGKGCLQAILFIVGLGCFFQIDTDSPDTEVEILYFVLGILFIGICMYIGKDDM